MLDLSNGNSDSLSEGELGFRPQDTVLRRTPVSSARTSGILHSCPGCGQLEIPTVPRFNIYTGTFAGVHEWLTPMDFWSIYNRRLEHWNLLEGSPRDKAELNARRFQVCSDMGINAYYHICQYYCAACSAIHA